MNPRRFSIKLFGSLFIALIILMGGCPLKTYSVQEAYRGRNAELFTGTFTGKGTLSNRSYLMFTMPYEQREDEYISIITTFERRQGKLINAYGAAYHLKRLENGDYKANPVTWDPKSGKKLKIRRNSPGATLSLEELNNAWNARLEFTPKNIASLVINEKDREKAAEKRKELLHPGRLSEKIIFTRVIDRGKEGAALLHQAQAGVYRRAKNVHAGNLGSYVKVSQSAQRHEWHVKLRLKSGQWSNTNAFTRIAMSSIFLLHDQHIGKYLSSENQVASLAAVFMHYQGRVMMVLIPKHETTGMQKVMILFQH